MEPKLFSMTCVFEVVIKRRLETSLDTSLERRKSFFYKSFRAFLPSKGSVITKSLKRRYTIVSATSKDVIVALLEHRQSSIKKDVSSVVGASLKRCFVLATSEDVSSALLERRSNRLPKLQSWLVFIIDQIFEEICALKTVTFALSYTIQRRTRLTVPT